jgi:hypothetical protein
MFVEVLGNVLFCLAATVLCVLVVAFRVAAFKTPPPKPGESRREANKRLNQAALAELRAWLDGWLRSMWP